LKQWNETFALSNKKIEKLVIEDKIVFLKRYIKH
jgi:hypothetical protein